MTIAQMKEIKKQKHYTYQQISENTQIPVSTLQKVFSGSTDSPRYDTLHALELFFAEEKQGMLREEAVYHFEKKQGEYTLDDYYALPDERRVELIDGVIYDMSAPTSAHQLIAAEIYRLIANYIRDKGGNCVPFISPIDVQLDCDQKTMIQPDVVIVCDRDKIINRCIYGAPDFVLEVLSPTTRRKDCIKKLEKYMSAGVREYWIIDPKNRSVLVYDFEGELYPCIYGFDTTISMALFQGDLSVDMVELSTWVDEICHEE